MVYHSLVGEPAPVAGVLHAIAPEVPNMSTLTLAAWQKCFRDGFASVLTLDNLLALERGLARNDRAILQGATTIPLPEPDNAAQPIKGGDPVAYALWKSGSVKTVGQAEESFARICYEVDMKMGEPAASRYFLNWWDEANRDTAIHELYAEVTFAIMEKKGNGF